MDAIVVSISKWLQAEFPTLDTLQNLTCKLVEDNRNLRKLESNICVLELDCRFREEAKTVAREMYGYALYMDSVVRYVSYFRDAVVVEELRESLVTLCDGAKVHKQSAENLVHVHNDMLNILVTNEKSFENSYDSFYNRHRRRINSVAAATMVAAVWYFVTTRNSANGLKKESLRMQQDHSIRRPAGKDQKDIMRTHYHVERYNPEIGWKLPNIDLEFVGMMPEDGWSTEEHKTNIISYIMVRWLLFVMAIIILMFVTSKMYYYVWAKPWSMVHQPRLLSNESWTKNIRAFQAGLYKINEQLEKNVEFWKQQVAAIEQVVEELCDLNEPTHQMHVPPELVKKILENWSSQKCCYEKYLEEMTMYLSTSGFN